MLPLEFHDEDSMPTAIAQVLLERCGCSSGKDQRRVDALWERCGCSKSRIRDESMLLLECYHEDPISTATADVLWERCER